MFEVSVSAKWQHTMADGRGNCDGDGDGVNRKLEIHVDKWRRRWRRCRRCWRYVRDGNFNFRIMLLMAQHQHHQQQQEQRQLWKTTITWGRSAKTEQIIEIFLSILQLQLQWQRCQRRGLRNQQLKFIAFKVLLRQRIIHYSCDSLRLIATHSTDSFIHVTRKRRDNAMKMSLDAARRTAAAAATPPTAVVAAAPDGTSWWWGREGEVQGVGVFTVA